MKNLQLTILREYWRHAWRYKTLTISTLIAVPFAVGLFGFLPPLFIAQILGTISSGDIVQGNLWASFGTPLLWYIAASVVGGIIAWRVAIILIWSLEMRVMRDIYQRVFNHLMSQSMNFHADRFGGSLVSQSSKFASAYVRVQDTMVFELYTMFISFTLAFAVLYPRAPLVSWGLLATSAVFIVISIFLTRAVRRLRAREAKAENQQTGYLADAITNVLAIKSFASEAYENKRFAGVTEKVRGATNDVMWASMKREVVFSFSTIAISVVSLVGALIGVVYYDADVATVYLVIAYTSQITQRLWDFAQNTLKNLNRAMGDAEEMTKILALTPEIRDPEQPLQAHINRGDILIKDMTFQHSGSNDAIFDKLNLHIKPGEKIGLVGKSGSGKTTFTRVLLRFSEIDGGSILIDGQSISELKQTDLHNAIAFVPQEPLLFHRSIQENIAYDRINATQQEVEAAAKMANAHEFIVNLPDGYKTLVGERGVKLSGGQRQRVAIARALLKNAPVLVLDEATSALDSESEGLIQAALWKLMEGKTAIVIAHRLSTIQKMDRIVVLDDGAILEQGSHKELLAKKGTYASLWAHQSGGFLED